MMKRLQLGLILSLFVSATAFAANPWFKLTDDELIQVANTKLDEVAQLSSHAIRGQLPEMKKMGAEIISRGIDPTVFNPAVFTPEMDLTKIDLGTLSKRDFIALFEFTLDGLEAQRTNYKLEEDSEEGKSDDLFEMTETQVFQLVKVNMAKYHASFPGRLNAELGKRSFLIDKAFPISLEDMNFVTLDDIRKRVIELNARKEAAEKMKSHEESKSQKKQKQNVDLTTAAEEQKDSGEDSDSENFEVEMLDVALHFDPNIATPLTAEEQAEVVRLSEVYKVRGGTTPLRLIAIGQTPGLSFY